MHSLGDHPCLTSVEQCGLDDRKIEGAHGSGGGTFSGEEACDSSPSLLCFHEVLLDGREVIVIFIDDSTKVEEVLDIL